MSLAAATAPPRRRNVATGATGPKISSLSRRASTGHPGEHRRLVEVAGAVALGAAEHDLAPFRLGVVDELLDLLALRRVDQRADLDVVLGAAPDRHLAELRRRASRRTRPARSRRRGSGWPPCTPRRCCASWRSPRPRPRRRGRRRRRRGTARCRRAPSTRAGAVGGLLDQLAADLGRAGERQLAQPRVADDRLRDVARLARGDDVEHAGRAAPPPRGSRRARASTAASAAPA